MNTIANVASIMTIILFIFYFLGRFIIIIKEKENKYEQIDLYITNDNEVFKEYKIIEEYNLDEDCNEYMIITPREKSYNWFKIYEYDDESNKKNCIYNRNGFLNSGHSIKIKAKIAECIPKYIIKFERSDYIVGEMELSHNGKNGVQEELIKCKHTWKSILYYILK